MGFDLVKVVAAATPGSHGGWSKHFFYATGDTHDAGMIAFWEIHDDTIGNEFPVDINASAGLPWWVNHIAFDAPTRADLDRHRTRWQECGYHVLEVDHEFCVSIYIRDPSGNMVEFCHSVRDFTADELAHASATLTDPQPTLDRDYQATVWEPTGAKV